MEGKQVISNVTKLECVSRGKSIHQLLDCTIFSKSGKDHAIVAGIKISGDAKPWEVVKNVITVPLSTGTKCTITPLPRGTSIECKSRKPRD